MAKGLKTNGMKELKSLMARTSRQHNLGRIGRKDKEYIMERLQEVEARIVKMREEGEANLWL